MTLGDGVIRLNSSISDPSKYIVRGSARAGDIKINLVADLEKEWGLSGGSVDTDTFWAIFLLHEIGHIFSGLPDDLENSELSHANTLKVLNECFKDLKKR